MAQPCRHPDIRQFDGVRACLACGEAIFDHAVPIPASVNANDTRYQYKKLNYTLGQEIRLLVVKCGEQDDPLRCDIIVANLDDEPRYEAVSYTWATESGDTSFSGVIHCPGGTVSVTTNCQAAIRRLRSRYSDRRLWIDAVCIDQENVAERNHQVALMEKIYSGAAQVLVFIDASIRKGPFAPLCKWLQGPPDVEPSKDEIDVATGLLKRRWFKRVWVIQEMALARLARLYLPDAEIGLNDQVIGRLHELWQLHQRVLGIDWPSPLRWTPEKKETLDLAYLLRATHKCSATDERDRIYAILSLVDSEYRSLISIDYAKSPALVYAEMARAIILRRRNLDALHLHWNVSNADWPSWVPHYGNEQRQDHLENGIVQFEGDSLGAWRSTLSFDERWGVLSRDHGCSSREASGTVEFFNLTISAGNHVKPCLRVRAHYIDKIGQQTSDPSAGHWWSGVDWNWNIPIHNYNFWESFGPQPHPAFFMSMHYVKSFIEAGRKIGATPQVFQTKNSVGFAIEQHLTRMMSSQGGFGEIAAETVRNQSFDIFALDGSRCPFILRKRADDAYEIVSECYVMRALDLHDGSWKEESKWGPWGELPDPLPVEERSRMIDIC